MGDATKAHRVTVTIADQAIDGWIEYDFECSMVEPVDSFSLTRPFSLDAWKLCLTDARVRIAVDGIVMVDGFIDTREYSAKEGTMQISGRDKAGRLVQESIPKTTGWDGLNLVEAIKQLASPWFTTVTLSDARNRSVRRGKGHKAPAGSEPAIFDVSGKLDEEHAGRLDPGEMRWNVIEQLCSSVSLLCWSSGDGRELVVGKPNYKQEPQYLLRHSRSQQSTVTDLKIHESVQDMYALIEAHGQASGSDSDYGNGVSGVFGTAKEGPFDDGTGRSFIHPKRLVMHARAYDDNAEAKRAAEREMKRRAFNRNQVTAWMPTHGQVYSGTQRTLFAPNTLARVVVDEHKLDAIYLVYAVKFRCTRKAGETTELRLVPRGTEFVS